MMEMHRVFVICRNGGDPKNPNDYCCYAFHGEKCGVPNAIGYDNAAHAHKFRSIEDAREYIEHKLQGGRTNTRRVSGADSVSVSALVLVKYE